MAVVGGFALADGTTAKALTGVDDHSRLCVSARLMPKERTQAVCNGLAAAMRRHGVPEQILTDNGKVFTGRFGHPPVEVLFDRICRENGVEHLLTAPRSPTTTGKIERFHRSLRAEFDTARVFTQPGGRPGRVGRVGGLLQHPAPAPGHRGRDPGETWVSRKVTTNGVVCVGWQLVSLGKHRAGSRADVLVTDGLLQFWIGGDLLKTVARDNDKAIRNKHAAGTSPRP